VSGRRPGNASPRRARYEKMDTTPYGFSTQRRGAKVALEAPSGPSRFTDTAIQTAIALGVPVIDDIVIDTLAAHQAAAYQGPMAGVAGSGYSGSAGPFVGLGYPGAGMADRCLTPTRSRFWEALTIRSSASSRRHRLSALVGSPDRPTTRADAWRCLAAEQWSAGRRSERQPGHSPRRFYDPQAANLPSGTIDMAIDPRGSPRSEGMSRAWPSGSRSGKGRPDSGVTQVINLLKRKARHDRANGQAPAPPSPPNCRRSPRERPWPRPSSNGPPIVADADAVDQKAARSVASRTAGRIRTSRSGFATAASITGRCRRSTRRCSPSGPSSARPASGKLRIASNSSCPMARGSIPSPKRDDRGCRTLSRSPDPPPDRRLGPHRSRQGPWRLARPERDPRPP